MNRLSLVEIRKKGVALLTKYFSIMTLCFKAAATFRYLNSRKKLVPENKNFCKACFSFGWTLIMVA